MILGHIQRGGAPSAQDRLLAARFGIAALERFATGERGVMVGLRGGEIATTPLAEVAAGGRRPEMEYYRMARMLAQ